MTEECWLCEALKNGKLLADGGVWRMVETPEGRLLAIWHEHVDKWGMKVCCSKLVTMKVDADLTARKRTGSSRVNVVPLTDFHIAFEALRY